MMYLEIQNHVRRAIIDGDSVTRQHITGKKHKGIQPALPKIDAPENKFEIAVAWLNGVVL